MNAEDLVRAAFDALDEGGRQELIRRYDDFFTADFEFTPALTGSVDGQTYRARDGFIEYWDNFEEGFSERTFHDASFEAVRPTVVLVVARMKLVGRESGIPLEQDVSFVCELRDGRVARMRSYLTPAEGREAAHAEA